MEEKELLCASDLSTNLSNFIGCGIDIMKASGPYADQLKRPILKINKVSKELVKTLPVYEGNIHHQSSDSLKEIYSEWSVNASAGIDTPFFSGSFKAEYSNKGRSNHCNKFFKGIVSIKGYSHLLNLPNETTASKEAMIEYLISHGYVDEVALKNIRSTMNPANVFNIYGTHVVAGGLSGGCIQITAQYSSDSAISEQKFNAALEFACGFATGKSSGGFNEEQKSVLEKTVLIANSRGGDPRIIGALTKFEEIPDTFKAWSNSVAESNYVLTDISDAIPIWEFCDDEKRQQDFIDIYNNSCSAQFQSIEAYFPSPKEKEYVIIYPTINHRNKLSKNADQFAVFKSEGVILVKELVSKGSDIYRFKLFNSKNENSYLCVSEKGPFGDFIHLAFTGNKDSEYAKFYLERNQNKPNAYYFKALKTSQYVTSNTLNGTSYLLTHPSFKYAVSLTIYTKEI